MNSQDILKLAEKHGLHLQEQLTINDMGADFQIAFATDTEGRPWVLRMPRRPDLQAQIEKESKILTLVKAYLSVAVPDWKIANEELIAYPMIPEKPALTYDSQTWEVTWYMGQQSPAYVSSLAKVLVELHQVPVEEVATQGLRVLTAADLKKETADRLDWVRRELGIGPDLEKRLESWLANETIWPDFTTFIHGDLFAGHLLVQPNGTVGGVIDWSEGHVSDPAIDFSGHLSVFGPDSLQQLIRQYQELGGKVWDGIYEQTVERQASTPLNYGAFALITEDERHLEAAKAQLHAPASAQ
jgi:macrolide phosphotransferase